CGNGLSGLLGGRRNTIRLIRYRNPLTVPAFYGSEELMPVATPFAARIAVADETDGVSSAAK
ncbi:MAG: hypothetical protein RMK49_00005, partial [Abditibacteriales bacterium]|nr:hypothetical protein [Abditibacteriales bacterium]